MTTRQNHLQTSIREMTKAQRGAAIRALTDAIGASDVFEQMGRAGEVVGVDDINNLLTLSDWPSADSTSMELAWLSAPLQGSSNPKFDGYSVFWSLTHDGFAVWTGRTPDRPTNEKACLRNHEVATAIAEAYGFFSRPRLDVTTGCQRLADVCVPYLLRCYGSWSYHLPCLGSY